MEAPENLASLRLCVKSPCSGVGEVTGMLTAWLNFGAWTCAHAPMRVRCLVDAAVGKGQERDMPRLFNCRRNDALMFGAGAGLAAGAQTAFFGHVFAEKVDLFVVDGQGFVGAELAELGLGKELAVAAARFAAGKISFVTHNLLQTNSLKLRLKR